MPSIPRDSFVLLALFATGAASVAAYSYLTGAHPTRSPATAAGPFYAVRAEASSGARPQAAARPADTHLAMSADVAPSEQKKRADALAALARPSGLSGIPALEKAIRNGEQPERDVALSSLRALAQTHGDEDQRIRNSLRETISHTSNEALILHAQETLDQIEQDLIAAAQASGL